MFGTYRTLLALMVVALHLGGATVLGAYAVFGFYILSGYLMTLIMHDQYGYTSLGRCSYAINRFLRIYPIYWVSILFSMVLILLVGGQVALEFHSSIYWPTGFAEVTKNVLLFFPFREPPRLTPPAWALTVEIFYYILIGIGISKTKRLVLWWLLISVIYHAVVLYCGFGWEYQYFSILAASLPFATGALIYHYKDKVLKYIASIGWGYDNFLPFMVFSLVLSNWLFGYFFEALKGVFFYSNYILCALMVVVLSERQSLPYISTKFDKWMGDFSYPIYLIHYQVGLIVVVVVNKFGGDIHRPSQELLFISIPFVFLAAWMIVVTLERPIERVRKRVKEKRFKLF